MSQLISKIADVAANAFNRQLDSVRQGFFDSMHDQEPILQAAAIYSSRIMLFQSEVEDLNLAFESDQDFSTLLNQKEKGVMVFTQFGGTRIDKNAFIRSIFSAALMKMFFLDLPEDSSVFVRVVLENIEDIKKSINSGEVKTLVVNGFARMELPDGVQIATPWGTLKGLPKRMSEQILFPRMFGPPATRSIFIEERLVQIKYDTSKDPKFDFQSESFVEKSASLFPFACALSSTDSASPIIPVLTWTTNLLPINPGMSYRYQIVSSAFDFNRRFDAKVEDIEEWSRIIDKNHCPEVEIAMKRLLSSVAIRNDKIDSLIDAVMVWENHLGTHNEVTFRISAAIAKMLERDLDSRRALKKRLTDIYGIRSKIVHGAHEDADKIAKAATEAIEIAIKILQISFKKGKPWLSKKSSERSDEILMAWP